MRYNWEGPASIPGFGERFDAGFQAGRRGAALGRYQQDPQAGINALLPVDPALAMQLQTSVDQRARLNQEQQQKKHDRDTKVIATMAQNARDPQSWDAAVDQIVAMGYPDAAQFKGKFSPAVRAAIMAAGGIEDNSGEVKWVSVPNVGAFATDDRGHPVAPGQLGSPLSPPQPAQALPGTSSLAQPTAAGISTDALFDSVIQQESGGRAGVLGQMTKYGRPMGMTQMLPATAREMAVKLGLPWRPELLSGTTPEAAEYQRTLGRAYLEQGLAEHGGDPRAAAMYYHGGPNQEIWGPKTRRYADEVLARAGGMPQGAITAAVAAPAPDIQQQAASGVVRAPQQAPPGFRWRADGSLEPIPGGPGDKTLEQRNRREDRSTTQGNRQEDRVAQLRQEFNGLPIVKDFNTVRIATKQIQTLATSVPANAPGRAQADMAMVFTFMKVLDPSSTVREGEYANAQNAAGIPERVRNQYNSALDGSFLSPQQRNGMVKAAQDLYISRAEVYNETAGQYRQSFQELGVDPRRYVPIATPGRGGPLRMPNQRAGAPRPGEVRRGYRFKGGDPANPGSWEKVR